MVTQDDWAEIWVFEGDPAEQRNLRQVLGTRWELVFWSDASEWAETGKATDRPKTSPGASRGRLPAAVLLDLFLPEQNLFREIAREDSRLRREVLDRVPWMVVSATADLDTLRACFRAGAADTLVRPCHPSELLIRVERLVRPKGTPVLSEEMSGLTLRETRILKVLEEARGRPVRRGDLIEQVWMGVRISPNGLDVHLSRLRGKLAVRGWTIEAQRGGEGWTLKQSLQAYSQTVQNSSRIRDFLLLREFR